MLFCQMAHADSLREICNGLACCLGKLTHLGIATAPKKSTLAYANQRRPASLFEDLLFSALDRFRSQGVLGNHRPAKFRFRNKLLSLDATVISLCLKLFPWADFRTAKGGVKVHVLLDHDDYMPAYVLMTDAKRADVKIAQSLHLNAGSIVAMDRAYNDFALFGRWSSNGIFFVTRMKGGTRYEVLEARTLPKNRPILADEIIQLTSKKGRKDCPDPLRRVVVWDAENEREIVLLSNHLGFGATTLANIYRERWKIELFFKELKSTLGFAQYRFQNFRAVKAWVEMAITTVLFLEYERIRHIQDRRLSEQTRRWWESQRLHGLCHAYRQQCAGAELKYLSDRLKTPGGIDKLRRLLTAALPQEYRALA